MVNLSKDGMFVMDSEAQRKLSTVAALAVLLYEYFITLRDEIRYIWRRPFNTVLGTYLFSKYVGIFAQSFNVYKVFGPLAAPGTPEDACRLWFASQIGIELTLLAGLDFILMLRIYALYQKRKRIGTLLAALFIGTVISDVVFTYQAVYDDVPFSAVCDALKTHPAVLYFGIVLWCNHLMLLILTIAKYNLTVLGIPIAKLVTRDGLWVVGLMCVLFGVAIPYELTSRISRADLVFVWPITFFSIACCRVVMNLQTFYADGNQDPEPDSQATTDSGRDNGLFYDY